MFGFEKSTILLLFERDTFSQSFNVNSLKVFCEELYLFFSSLGVELYSVQPCVLFIELS